MDNQTTVATPKEHPFKKNVTENAVRDNKASTNIGVIVNSTTTKKETPKSKSRVSSVVIQPYDPYEMIPGTEMYFPSNGTHNSALYLRRYRNHKRVKSLTVDISDYNKKRVFLFVVNFHFAFYKNIPFMDDEYFPLFAKDFNHDFDVVYIGPQKDREYHALSNNLPSRGYYSYHSFTVALSCFPPNRGFNYAGVFLMNDDSCLHPKLLNEYDLAQSHGESISSWSSKIIWMWNTIKNQHGITFAQSYLNAIKVLKNDSVVQSVCNYDEKKLVKGWSDLFYVTKKDIELFLRIEKVMYDNRVFLENAVPAIMRCLKATEFNNCNHGSMPKILKCVHVHPVKLSDQSNRDLCINRIKSISMGQRPHTYYLCVCSKSTGSLYRVGVSISISNCFFITILKCPIHFLCILKNLQWIELRCLMISLNSPFLDSISILHIRFSKTL